MKYLDAAELELGLEDIRQSPREHGAVKMIVLRPAVGEREILDQGEPDVTNGLAGDNWSHRGSSRTLDGSSRPKMQLNIMNSRVIALVAQTDGHWLATNFTLI